MFSIPRELPFSSCIVLQFSLQDHLNSCSEEEKNVQERLIEPLMRLVKFYEGGRERHARGIVHSLFEEYLSVEGLFSDNIPVSHQAAAVCQLCFNLTVAYLHS